MAALAVNNSGDSDRTGPPLLTEPMHFATINCHVNDGNNNAKHDGVVLTSLLVANGIIMRQQ